jgi:hypothetical protein
MPLMHYVRVTCHGRIIVLQSEMPTHIIAASTTTEQDVGNLITMLKYCLLEDDHLQTSPKKSTYNHLQGTLPNSIPSIKTHRINNTSYSYLRSWVISHILHQFSTILQMMSLRNIAEVHAYLLYVRSGHIGASCLQHRDQKFPSTLTSG